jgi:arylsulfatase A-like enzyme
MTTMTDDSIDTTSDPGSSGMSRRRLLQAMGITGVAAAAMAAGTGTAMAAPMQPFRPRGRLRRRPNFLVFVVDEQRHAPVYESEELKAWRQRNLPTQNKLRANGLDFTNHHIMSAACAPSRASIFTGQYPSLHGVSQTTGAAKGANESDTYWLDPTTVPTMGSWFRAGGYQTFYKGKWHVSDGDLYQPGSHNPLPSYNQNGVRDPYLEDIYLEAGILEDYGFTGWIGPEPHGSNPLNSGSSAPGGRGRDQVFAEWGVEQLQSLRTSTKPWLMVNSYVNPHDITLWGDLTVAGGTFYLEQQLAGSDVPHNLFDPTYRASANEDLSVKPSAQANYRDQYPLAFQPLTDTERYQRFYYQLQQNVDTDIGRVLKALTQSGPQYRDTIVVYISDHGELLGSHGGMFQKWASSYDEVMRVPLVLHNPRLFSGSESTELLTSHADLIPTMLGLAGLDEAVLAKSLKKTHTQVQRLPGRDLSGFVLGEVDEAGVPGDAVYFMTDDQPFTGSKNVSWRGTMYTPIVQPSHIESVVAMLPTGPAGARERWKLVRYWDNPAFWSTPNSQDVLTIVNGLVNRPGEHLATTTVKTMQPTNGQVGPAPDQWEAYNLVRDPLELTNLYTDPDSQGTINVLNGILNEQRTLKRLTPQDQPYADGSQVQFGFDPTSSIAMA